MTTTHTPGPWKAGHAKSFSHYLVYSEGKDGGLIALVNNPQAPEMNAANALFIALGPDMETRIAELEQVLRDVLIDLDFNDDMVPLGHVSAKWKRRIEAALGEKEG